MAPRAHARLSPSSASRWMRCPGSVNFLDGYEDDAGEAADEGTILHSFCESCLRENCEAYEFIGETREHNGVELELTEELADMIQAGLDEIDVIPGKLFIEYRVDLSRWMKGQFGTLDVGIVNRRRIHIWDWKWGFHPVSPVQNEQEMIYALGFWDNVARHRTDAKDFRLHIFQPRTSRGGGEWDITLEELLDFGSDLKKAAARTYDEDAPRIPGPLQCHYCPGARKLGCPEYNAYMLKMVAREFEDDDEALEDLDEQIASGLGPRLPNALTPERRSFIIENWPTFQRWYERLYEQAVEDALHGNPVPGLKLVEGRGSRRVWHDEMEIGPLLKIKLGDKAFSRKVISPKQAELLLSPEEFKRISVEHVRINKSKPVLVSEHDSRKAIRSTKELLSDD